MVCVTTVSYSLSINGNLYGFFKGKRGLRQGDPISPYLFTLVMEVLSFLLKDVASNSTPFRYHLHCKKQKIINVSFADDLFMFANGDVASVKVLRDTLQRFTKISGLVPSMPKCTVFFGNVPQSVKQEILHIMPFKEGSLPVRYLGVPLISSKLSYKDCKILVERMDKKIDNWMTRSLSFAGRLQLVNSVLSAMHIYWATIFLLPAKIVSDLERRMRAFLWTGKNQLNVKAKVAWKLVCLPKNEGGLGVRCIADVNKALISNHIWSILANRKSLWVQWIHIYKLKGRSFWEIPCRGRMTWGWRKILAMRDLISPYLWKAIGNGANTNVWSDTWCSACPLRAYISPRIIANAGFNLQSSVADMVDSGGHWRWSVVWYDLFPVLINIHVPALQDMHDRLIWINSEGKSCHFSSWEELANMVDVNGRWVDIMDWMNQNSIQQPVNVVSRLVVAAASYFVWQERNSRLFTRNQRTAMVLS
ncbi:putative RNA-directed DNA polymerase [Helianthus anomalus]